MRIRGKNVVSCAVAAVVAVTLGACSPSREQPSDLPPGAEPELAISAPSSSAQPEEGHGECTIDDFKVQGASGNEPTIVVPEGCAAPTKVLSKILDKGSGPAVKKGDTVSVNYVIVGFTGGKKASSWSSKTESEPQKIESVGDRNVVPGWDDALVGMKEGGRKLVVLPPEQGAAAEGADELGFDEDDTLVLVIGLTGIA